MDIATEALYDLLENKLHIQLSDAEQTITSNTLNSEGAELLGINQSDNTLQTERFLTDTKGALIENYMANCKANMYSFHIKLSREK
ncbi:hypothetical protein CSV74_06525 [Sporosarcina sp. P19]|nr:hypothetical protein CSV74_06525 [Sporosarcina sp. P19]